MGSMTTTHKRLPCIVLCAAVASLVPALIAGSAGATVPSDNGRIAFVGNRDGNDNIYSSNPDGSAVVPLTADAATDVAPAWSPDGQRIAFVTDRDGNYEIYVMAADGSGQTRLTFADEVDAEPRWSPDGSQIAFTSFRNSGGENGEIYVMGADGSNPTPLTANKGSDGTPAWSPDGRKIAYTSGAYNSDGEIYVMNADGSNPTPLTDNASADGSPAWSPDGERIAFASNRDGGLLDFRIYTMAADGSNQAPLPAEAGYASQPVWSPDGGKIAFTGIRSNAQRVRIVNADGSGGEAPLTGDPLVGRESGADWQSVPHVDVPKPAEEGGSADTVAPRISRFRAAPRRFSYTLSETAQVTLTIQRAVRGHKGRYRRIAVLSRAGRAGINRGRFGRRLARRTLRPGDYRAVITATDGTGNRSTARATRFKVARS